MKIVIAGGHSQAEFLISLFLNKKHKLTVINDDVPFCELISSTYKIPVINGDPSKEYILSEAGIDKADVLIALTPKDEDNFVICQYATKIFQVKRVICTVSNPSRVEVFKKLGLTNVLSATYMVAKYIEQTSTIENLVNTLSLEDEKVLLSEILIEETDTCINKKLLNIPLPKSTIISCIIRTDNIIIPNGQTVISAEDKLLIISTPENMPKALNVLKGREKK
ncbi:MAG: TrkA family potassium uptake protein [Clostridia bacterium]|nr:TrkA family potassium uptake protein [Clostridia bacterium]